MTKVTWVRLDFNFITALPTGVFDGADKLRVLALDNNVLSSLSSGVFDKLAYVVQISRGGRDYYVGVGMADLDWGEELDGGQCTRCAQQWNASTGKPSSSTRGRGTSR